MHCVDPWLVLRRVLSKCYAFQKASFQNSEFVPKLFGYQTLKCQSLATKEFSVSEHMLNSWLN